MPVADQELCVRRSRSCISRARGVAKYRKQCCRNALLERRSECQLPNRAVGVVSTCHPTDADGFQTIKISFTSRCSKYTTNNRSVVLLLEAIFAECASSEYRCISGMARQNLQIVGNGIVVAIVAFFRKPRCQGFRWAASSRGRRRRRRGNPSRRCGMPRRVSGRSWSQSPRALRFHGNRYLGRRLPVLHGLQHGGRRHSSFRGIYVFCRGKLRQAQPPPRLRSEVSHVRRRRVPRRLYPRRGARSLARVLRDVVRECFDISF